MTRAADALAALHEAIADDPPPCRGDDRYIDDNPALPELQLVCSTCFAFPECRAYALTARPAAGIWAGERWTEKRRPGQPRKETTA